MRTSVSHSNTVGTRASREAGGVLPFDFSPLNRVVFGAGSLARLGEFVRELGGRRVLLVTDRGLEEVGHPQRAVAKLLEANLEVSVFDDVEANPSTGNVEAATAFARNHKIDFIV